MHLQALKHDGLFMLGWLSQKTGSPADHRHKVKRKRAWYTETSQLGNTLRTFDGEKATRICHGIGLFLRYNVLRLWLIYLATREELISEVNLYLFPTQAEREPTYSRPRPCVPLPNDTEFRSLVLAIVVIVRV